MSERQMTDEQATDLRSAFDLPASSSSASEETTTTTTPSQGESQPTEAELKNLFLKDVDPKDRPTLERYVGQWDSAAQKKFKEYQDQIAQYKPFEGMDPEMVQAGLQLIQLLDQQPEVVYNLLKEQLDEQKKGQALAQPFPQQSQPTQPTSDELADLPEPVRNMLTEHNQVRQTLELLANAFLSQNQAQEQAKEDTALDNYITDLHKKHGDFDDEYVLVKMLNGMDGEQAVKAWNSKLQAQVNSMSKATPRTLSGGGGIPQLDNFDVKKASRNDVQDLIAQMVTNSNQNK